MRAQPPSPASLPTPAKLPGGLTKDLRDGLYCLLLVATLLAVAVFYPA